MTMPEAAPVSDPRRLLADLNPAQREAVEATSGPLVILAGAGTGKTRTISRRAAYAIETGATPAERILLVTFTDKAAREMADRMAALGHPGVMARTFHAAALAQLRHFWPLRNAGPIPNTLDSKARILAPLVGRLRAPFRFTPTRDVADAIEWAKVRRIPPERWAADGGARSSLPTDVFASVYREYERAKSRAGLLDFEDMLARTADLLESDGDAAEIVRRRRSWFSVDEYQDTNPLAERILALWAGPSRDIAVVGDPDQTIYTFTGATPAFLLSFEARHPGARRVVLRDNHRSTPAILELANRLMHHPPDRALRTAHPDGPAPAILRFDDGDAELRGVVAAIHRWTAAGLAPAAIAVLVRTNAQLPPLEDALTRAGIAFSVRGGRFFERPEIREARRLLARRSGTLTESGPALVAAVRRLFHDELGLDALEAGRAGEGAEGRERAASLELLISILADQAAADVSITLEDALAALDRRARRESDAADDGVNLVTYHRAKGLEWDAVFLPALEEGLLPVRQAKDDPEALAEERRLLYVGITRARAHLVLSWAARRTASANRETARKPSRFLGDLSSTTADARVQRSSARAAVPRAGRLSSASGPDRPARAGVLGVNVVAFDALRAWRRGRAASDGVPAYVVAHDSVLAAIADAAPSTLAGLRRIAGMGPARLDRYGEEILDVLRRSRAST